MLRHWPCPPAHPACSPGPWPALPPSPATAP
uniref:Uncharacterized protein n=1 Tax=Siphoviridae sp. ct2kB26 TaxID=2825317 RepID=A0A8S5PA16_9CAUD|nr:MAG TPA: hypothetical protein [Siphoviridae sp. ct2kB26]